MRKKISFIIFCGLFCVFLSPMICLAFTQELVCDYAIKDQDNQTMVSYNIHFKQQIGGKASVSEVWKYEKLTNETIDIKDLFTVKNVNLLDSLWECPSTVDVKNNELILSNNNYYLQSQIEKDDGEETQYSCKYVRSTNKKTYWYTINYNYVVKEFKAYVADALEGNNITNKETKTNKNIISSPIFAITKSSFKCPSFIFETEDSLNVGDKNIYTLNRETDIDSTNENSSKNIECDYIKKLDGRNDFYNIKLYQSNGSSDREKGKWYNYEVYYTIVENGTEKSKKELGDDLDNKIVTETEDRSCPLSFISNLDGNKFFSNELIIPYNIGYDDSANFEYCFNLKDENSCIQGSKNYACVWIDHDASPFGGFCNVDNLLYVGCGGASDIPLQVPGLLSMCVNILKIAAPIILIFVSVITLLKALAAQKEDEIKKAQSSLIKKVIAAATVFFVVSIVQFVISKVVKDEDDFKDFSSCLNCFLNNKCDQSTYYKTVIGGEDFCTPLNNGETDICNKVKDKNVATK